ncbi:RNA-splicing factor [Orbilia ellipsospora]|uniref:Pre-mRNA-splicing factor CWC24 n=1 Tax=Orbilia ellipsospora TaxID=2528407 RepID=A0AAV9XGC8_9PEZI
MSEPTSLPDTSTTSPSNDPPVTFFKRKGNRSNLRKRPPTPPPKNSDSDDDSDYSSTDETTGAKLPSKRRKTKHTITTSSSIKPLDAASQPSQQSYTADRSTAISKSDDATKRSNWHNENEEEYLIRKSKPANPTDNTPGEDDGVYRGASGYKSFIRKNPDSIQNKGKMGPVKAPTNVRQVVTVDFAPDVCKDYKQTGFCGFGDTCKFLHAREDYKQGWELDRDWEIGKKKPEKQQGKDKDEDDDDEELKNIPFACVICKGEYKVPIVTKCGHYFCERCALQRYRKSPGCAICGAGTNGIFNTAKNLQKKLDKKRERQKAREEEEGGEGDGQVGSSGITIDA